MQNFFNSSVLEHAVYDQNTHVMLLTFKGYKMYAYNDVPLEMWNSFIQAESAGQYYNDNIRRNTTISSFRVV